MARALAQDNSSMKVISKAISVKRISTFIFLSCFLFFSKESKAADFSKAKQTYVPPSLIRRDLNSLGTYNWTFPGLDSSKNNQNNLDLNSILNGAINSQNQSDSSPVV